MIEFINKYIKNRSFFFGVILCFGMFSKYILGPNNLIEEIAELGVLIHTDQDVNFSDEEEDPHSQIKKVQEFIMLNGK